MKYIKVGDFVRTKNGEIAKIVDTNMFDKTIYKDIQGAKYYLEDIVKYSPNIIDLIEVGDYVNGSRVDELYDGYVFTENSNYKLDNIKSIVTHEQFSSVMYEV